MCNVSRAIISCQPFKQRAPIRQVHVFLISRVGLEDTSGLNRETEPPPPPHRYASLLFLRAEASSLCDADDEPITAELREKQKKIKN